MQTGQRRGRAALALLGTGTILGTGILGAILSAGCGSSSTDATARIRAADVATNAATAGVLINGGAEGGDLSFGQVTSYEYIGQGDSTFGYTTTAVLPTGYVIPPSPTLTLNNNSHYTAYLIGRSDVLAVGLKANPRFLQTVITGDRGAAANYASGAAYADPPSGQANVRILNGAVDAGAVDVFINGGSKPAFAAVVYPALPALNATTNVALAVTPATSYLAVPGGTISVQVNAAGTSTVLLPPTNVSVSGGSVYTLVFTEPTIAPTYALTLVSD